MAYITVVEDETSLRTDLVEYLSSCGHDVTACADSVDLDRVIKAGMPDLVILDVNLPGEDGFSIAKRLREQSDTGIIILTARGVNFDRVIGLEVGADVYMVKPVEFRELEAQVRTLLRRVRPHAASICAPASPLAGADEFWLYDNVGWNLVSPDGQVMKLTATERIFISLLVNSPGEPVSRREIFRALGKREWDAGDRSVDSMVRRLRAKSQSTLGVALPIEAVHGTGYAFTAPVSLR